MTNVCAKGPTPDGQENGMQAVEPALLTLLSDEESRDVGPDE